MPFSQKNIKYIVISLFFLIMVFVPSLIEAATFLTGDTSRINPEETVNDDVYMFGDTVNLSGTVHGDAVIFAREAIIDGTVNGSLLVFAQNVSISGDVEGTIRGGANTFYFQGSTGRDLMMAANTISVAGTIGQDFFGGANSVTITGSVGRNVNASINRLLIDAPVGGDVDAYVSELSFGSGAEVDGRVTYTSETDAVLDNQAVISGAINRLDPPSETMVKSTGRSAWGLILPILSLLVVALVMGLLFPILTAGTARTIKEQPGLSIGYGALVVFVAPVAAIILLITVIGIPISFLSLLLYIVLIYLARIFAGYFLAQMVFRQFGKELHPVWTVLTGTLVLALLIKIPYVGWLVHLVAVLFAAGAFIIYLAGKKQETEAMAEQVAE